MRHREGVTFVEALIAIAVIGVVFVALAALQVASLRVTSEAQVDSALLAQAVTEFERARSTVLSSFDTFYIACGAATNCWSDPDDAVILQRAVVFVPDEDNPAAEPEAVEVRGLLELQVTVFDRTGRELFFKQYVSCLDADEVPTLSSPGVCDGAGTGS